MFKIFKPIPVIAVTTMTLSGMLLHDMHIDKAAAVAVALPAIVAAGALEHTISHNYHTHVDRAELPGRAAAQRSSLPNMQPPRDDDRKYIQNKKLMFMGGGDAVGIWPSV